MIVEAPEIARRARAFVALSDGGHFENLERYEVLRRRCLSRCRLDGFRISTTAVRLFPHAREAALLGSGSLVAKPKHARDPQASRHRALRGAQAWP